MRFTSVDAVAAYLQALPIATHRRIIGIAGAPGAGKSTFAERLTARIGWALLPMDGFHLPQARLIELGRRDRMGAPDTFDLPALLQTLADLRISGGTVFAPGFNRDAEEPAPDAIAIQPERDVVLEGIYLLHEEGGWHEVAPLLDLVFFIELETSVRHARLITRHEHFGKSAEAARAWALGPDEANAELVAATATRADHVVQLD